MQEINFCLFTTKFELETRRSHYNEGPRELELLQIKVDETLATTPII